MKVMDRPPMIAGLYRYVRNGVASEPRKTLTEIPRSLALNPRYRDEFLFLAGDEASGRDLESFGIEVSRVFADAPEDVRRDAAHKMKHWMCLWAIQEYGEVLWVDWDTVCLRWPDADFWSWCRRYGTPKFVLIPNYWATVNCAVYYANAVWADAMERSFQARVPEPNDELLWRSVLPEDIVQRPEFWWGDRVMNIWKPEEVERVTPATYFAHVRYFEYAELLRREAVAAEAGGV